MIDFPYIAEICQSTPSRILMLVVDGLGGTPHPERGESELEAARTPNLDRLASRSACGLTTPVLPGITPGSGPGHLSLFGYDPLKYFIGRGVLEALGVEVEMHEGDVAARGNFCTVDGQGRLVDRRAGRISSKESIPLCQQLDQIEVPGLEVRVFPVQDYRFVALFRGQGLSEKVTETDPQIVGVPPRQVESLDKGAEKTAAAANAFIEGAREVLGDREKANMVLLRGFSQLPALPSFGQTYRLNPAAIAAYPMYRGLTRVVGMKVIPTGSTFQEEVDTLGQHFQEHDFFYLHYKPADAAGEDGDFDAKVRTLEALDGYIPSLLTLKPDVFIVAGDHATPSLLANHSWHPVPLLLHSRFTLGEGVGAFHERAFATGSLGRIPATQVMLLALAHAGKLAKFGP
ncbi:MAG: 2,3-bisphosphoglycerate-independent phosphoglycerate mutase [Chloroflexi bacterium]|nr:2,3-bisphosphoglycerate-independent phosphoglycerate mutase [Chloroflexota bacterium]